MKKFRGVFLKNENEIRLMREANLIGREILEAMVAEVQPGVPTMHFEEVAQKICKQRGVRPAFQGYHGFPFALCCSVNEEVVHGFPSGRLLKEGDIVSFDMGVEYEGFYSDSALTVPVGKISPDAEHLLKATEESLWKGIEEVRPGNTLKDVCAAIERHAIKNKLGIVKRFVGHGIGRAMHEKPEIPNFVPLYFNDIPLKAGMVLAIEPMMTLGTDQVDILDDQWTAVTRDGKYAAHFEHSVAVTPSGPLVLSKP